MKNQLSFDQHRQLGGELAQARIILLRTLETISTGMGTSSKACRKAYRAVKAVDDLKSELDEVVCRGFPERTVKEKTGCYYGREDDRRKPTLVPMKLMPSRFETSN